MAEKIGRCGFRCDLCPAYKDNIHGLQDQKRVSDGWLRYYGFRIPPEDICCDGCRDESQNARRIDADCKVRPCVMARGLNTCAACEQYPCEELKNKIISLSWVESQTGESVPKDDYETFVLPYEADKVLDRIREKDSQ